MSWLKPDGNEMDDDDWDSGFAKSVGVFLNGQSIHASDAFGGKIVDDSFLILFNASELDLDWQLPGARFGARWVFVLDSSRPDVGTPDLRIAGAHRTGAASEFVDAGAVVPIASRSLILLRQTEAVPSTAHPAKKRKAAAPSR